MLYSQYVYYNGEPRQPSRGAHEDRAGTAKLVADRSRRAFRRVAGDDQQGRAGGSESDRLAPRTAVRRLRPHAFRAARAYRGERRRAARTGGRSAALDGSGDRLPAPAGGAGPRVGPAG